MRGGSGRIDVALEVHEAASRVLPHHLLGDTNGCTVEQRVGDAERGLGVAPGRALEHLAGSDRVATERCVGPGD